MVFCKIGNFKKNYGFFRLLHLEGKTDTIMGSFISHGAKKYLAQDQGINSIHIVVDIFLGIRLHDDFDLFNFFGVNGHHGKLKPIKNYFGPAFRKFGI